MDAYFLYGADGEMLLVVRGKSEEEMLEIIDRIKKSRQKSIKQIGERLEEHFIERQDGR